MDMEKGPKFPMTLTLALSAPSKHFEMIIHSATAAATVRQLRSQWRFHGNGYWNL